MNRIIIAVIGVLVLIGLGWLLFFRADTQPVKNGETVVTEPTNGEGVVDPEDPALAERTVALYYYDESRDQDAQGNIMCSAQGLVGVERTIPGTYTPVQDTVRLLLRGEITSAEKARGIDTEFPLQGVSLAGANLANGVLTLEFNDPQNKTSGGSCRTGILWAQIERTARQFDGVNEVRFQPEELFQP